MKFSYLLLSVLVVCMIGVMVPSAFGETYSIYIDNKTFDTSGCYETESCLFPYVLYVEKGDSIQFVIDKYWRYTMVSGSIESGPYDPWVPSDGFSGGGVQMNEVGKFSYYDTAYPWLEGKVIVTEPGEYNIPEKYFPVKIKYDLIQKLEEDYGALFDLQRKASCYQMNKPDIRYDDAAISACTEVLEELKKIEGWSEPRYKIPSGQMLYGTERSLVFDPKVIQSEDNIAKILGKDAVEEGSNLAAKDSILALINTGARLVVTHNSIILKTMVTNAENTITSNPEITLDAQADLIYDLRKWKEVKEGKINAGYQVSLPHHNNWSDQDQCPACIFNSLKTTYKQLWDKADWMTQKQLAEEEKEEIKEEIKQEIGGVVEPKSEPTQTSEGCGAGTVLVNGVCQLAPTQSKTSSMSIEPLYIIIAVVGIGGIIGAIAVAKRGSKTPKPTKEKQKPVKQKPKPAKQKPVEKKETSAFCENCGNTLNPKAKFCGKCGNQV